MPNRLVVIRFPRVRVFMLEIWNRTRASNAPQCEPASKIHQEYQVSFKLNQRVAAPAGVLCLNQPGQGFSRSNQIYDQSSSLS